MRLSGMVTTTVSRCFPSDLMSGEDGDVVTEYFRSLILSEIRTGFVSSLSLITNGGHGHATLGAKSRYSLCTLYAIGLSAVDAALKQASTSAGCGVAPSLKPLKPNCHLPGEPGVAPTQSSCSK